MKKSICLLAIATCTLFASCTKESPVQDNADKTPLVFNAEFSAVKTSLDGYVVKWSESDEISIFDGSMANCQFTASSIDGASASFSGNAGAAPYVALYPYESDATLAGGTLSASLPSAQTAVAGSFDNGANIAVAKAETASAGLYFENLAGLLKFTVPAGLTTLKSVEIKSGNGEALAGAFTVNTAASGDLAAVKGEGSDKATLTASTAFSAGTYYAVVLPGTLTKGLVITLTDDSDKTVEVENTAEVTINAGKIRNIGTISDDIFSAAEESDPILTLNATEFTLAEATKAEVCLSPSWTSVPGTDEYSYILELTSGADDSFASPAYSFPAYDNAATLTQADLEIIIAKAGLDASKVQELNVRVRAVPTAGGDEIVSATKTIKVTSWARPIPEGITSMQVVGSGVPGQWDINSEAAQGTCVDAEKGIYMWQGHIGDNGQTFKVMFNKSWGIGMKHADNDYYIEGATYSTSIGDNDYFVLAYKGEFKIYVTVKTGIMYMETVSIDYTAANSVGNGLSNTWSLKNNLVSQNASNTIFKGTITVTDCTKGFDIMFSDWNRYIVASKRTPRVGLHWFVAETKYKDDPFGNTFMVPENGTYTCTLDLAKGTVDMVKQ